MTDEPETPIPEDDANVDEKPPPPPPALAADDAPSAGPSAPRALPAGIVGLLVALGLLWGFASLAGPPWLFVDPPSIIFVVGWAAATAIMVHGWANFITGMRGIGALFVDDGPDTLPASAVPVVGSFRRGLYAGGAIGVVMGVVQILANLSDPSAIGPGLSVALFSLFTALVLAELICRPALERLQRTGSMPRE